MFGATHLSHCVHSEALGGCAAPASHCVTHHVSLGARVEPLDEVLVKATFTNRLHERHPVFFRHLQVLIGDLVVAVSCLL